MPLVEAMASGIPVVASNTTSIPEIVGKSALLSDPEDYRKLSTNIELLIDNRRKRQELISAGLERARDFNWTDAAHQTLEVLKKAANS
jgi:alpha-1,3-rhamnosyl/mannosyltransferase